MSKQDKPPIDSMNYVGYYAVPHESTEYQIRFAVKPSWLHRKLTRLLLGLEWKDAPQAMESKSEDELTAAFMMGFESGKKGDGSKE